MRPVDLLARVAEHGFRLDVTPDGPVLVRTDPDATLPADLLTALKEHKAAVLKFVTCSQCGRAITCHEDRERVRDPAFCANSTCPYKRPGKQPL